jgi:hypothetical protein
MQMMVRRGATDGAADNGQVEETWVEVPAAPAAARERAEAERDGEK